MWTWLPSVKSYKAHWLNLLGVEMLWRRQDRTHGQHKKHGICPADHKPHGGHDEVFQETILAICSHLLLTVERQAMLRICKCYASKQNKKMHRYKRRKGTKKLWSKSQQQILNNEEKATRSKFRRTNHAKRCCVQISLFWSMSIGLGNHSFHAATSKNAATRKFAPSLYLSVAAQRERSETKSNERGLALLRVQISFWTNLQEVGQTKWSQMDALVARLCLYVLLVYERQPGGRKSMFTWGKEILYQLKLTLLSNLSKS
jgi:hypothetical protein